MCRTESSSAIACVGVIGHTGRPVTFAYGENTGIQVRALNTKIPSLAPVVHTLNIGQLFTHLSSDAGNALTQNLH